MDYILLTHLFITLFSILDPLGLIPIFLSITANESSSHRKITVRKTVIAVTVILLISYFVGNYILDFFSINIDSFRVAGGILLLLISIDMLHAKIPTTKTTQDEHENAIEKEDVSVVPLAIPLLVGPGSISTVYCYPHL